MGEDKITKKEKSLRRQEAGEDYASGGDSHLHASGISQSGFNHDNKKEGCVGYKLCRAASGQCCELLLSTAGPVCPASC